MRAFCIPAVLLAGVLGCSRPAPAPESAGTPEAPPARTPARERAKPPPRRAGADTPEEAVRRLEAAFQAGDLDAYLALLPREDGKRFARLVAAIRASERAGEAFEDALEARFGKDPERPKAEKVDVREILHMPGASFEVLGKKVKGPAHVELKVRMTAVDSKGKKEKPEEVQAHAFKEADGWKVRLEEALPDSAGRFFDRHRKAYEAVTADVKAGKLRSRAEARRAFLDRVKAAEGSDRKP